MNILKRHNAICIKRVTEAHNTLKQQLVKENILFAESLVTTLGYNTIVTTLRTHIGIRTVFVFVAGSNK